jgi:hypothetical protein
VIGGEPAIPCRARLRRTGLSRVKGIVESRSSLTGPGCGEPGCPGTVVSGQWSVIGFSSQWSLDSRQSLAGARLRTGLSRVGDRWRAGNPLPGPVAENRAVQGQRHCGEPVILDRARLRRTGLSRDGGQWSVVGDRWRTGNPLPGPGCGEPGGPGMVGLSGGCPVVRFMKALSFQLSPLIPSLPAIPQPVRSVVRFRSWRGGCSRAGGILPSPGRIGNAAGADLPGRGGLADRVGRSGARRLHVGSGEARLPGRGLGTASPVTPAESLDEEPASGHPASAGGPSRPA